MPDDPVYHQVINKIIERQIGLLGPLAVTKAKNVVGLQVNDAGQVVSITGNPILVIHNLVLKYEEVVGRAAIPVCKAAVLEFRTAHPELELPPRLM